MIESNGPKLYAFCIRILYTYRFYVLVIRMYNEGMFNRSKTIISLILNNYLYTIYTIRIRIRYVYLYGTKIGCFWEFFVAQGVYSNFERSD